MSGPGKLIGPGKQVVRVVGRSDGGSPTAWAMAAEAVTAPVVAPWSYFFFENMGWSGGLGLAWWAGSAVAVVGGTLWSKAADAAAVQRGIEQRHAERVAWLAGWPHPVQEALGRMMWAAPQLWAPMGLGREPRWVGAGRDAVWDPGEGPVLLEAEPTDLGVRVRLAMLDGHAAKHYHERRGQMRNAFNVPDVRVVGDKGYEIVLELVVFNPLSGMTVSELLDAATARRVQEATELARTPDELSKYLTAIGQRMQLTVPVDGLSCHDDIYCGPGEDGKPVVVNLAAGAHGAVQGAARSGKSIFLNTLAACGSLARDVRVVIIDPNTAAVAPWWRTAYLVCNSTDPRKATAVLRQVNKELRARESLFWAGRTDRITEFSRALPLYLVIIDEVAEYAKDKDFQEELSKAAAQLPKYGGRLYLAGQKLGEHSLSTTTRANLFDRFCFRVESRHDMAHLFENTPDLETKGLTAVDETMPQGVAIVRTRSHTQTTRMRAVYLPTEMCWVISDAIVAARGQVRALPGSEPTGPHPTGTEPIGDETTNAIGSDTPAEENVPAAGDGADDEVASADGTGENVVVLDEFRTETSAPGGDAGADGKNRCALPTCNRELEQTKGGRRRKYCCDAHRIEHFRDKKAKGV